MIPQNGARERVAKGEQQDCKQSKLCGREGSS